MWWGQRCLPSLSKSPRSPTLSLGGPLLAQLKEFGEIIWNFGSQLLCGLFFFLHHTFCFKNPFLIIVVSLSSYYQQLFRFNSKFYSYHWSVTYTLHLLFLEFLLPTFFFHLVEVFHEYDFFSEMAHFCTLYFPLFPPTGKTSFLAGVSCSSVLCHVLF